MLNAATDAACDFSIGGDSEWALPNRNMQRGSALRK